MSNKTQEMIDLFLMESLAAAIDRLTAEKEQLQAELDTYKAGNVPVMQIIADNEAMAMQIAELEEQLDAAKKAYGLLHDGFNEVLIVLDSPGWKSHFPKTIADLKECRKIAENTIKPKKEGSRQATDGRAKK